MRFFSVTFSLQFDHFSVKLWRRSIFSEEKHHRISERCLLTFIYLRCFHQFSFFREEFLYPNISFRTNQVIFLRSDGSVLFLSMSKTTNTLRKGQGESDSSRIYVLMMFLLFFFTWNSRSMRLICDIFSSFLLVRAWWLHRVWKLLQFGRDRRDA